MRRARRGDGEVDLSPAAHRRAELAPRGRYDAACRSGRAGRRSSRPCRPSRPRAVRRRRGARGWRCRRRSWRACRRGAAARGARGDRRGRACVARPDVELKRLAQRARSRHVKSEVCGRRWACRRDPTMMGSSGSSSERSRAQDGDGLRRRAAIRYAGSGHRGSTVTSDGARCQSRRAEPGRQGADGGLLDG